VQDRDVEDPRQSIADRVYNQLRRRIVAGDISPREEVREASVARNTGASRTPVREALRRLEAEGLISRSLAGAYAVTEVSAQELIDIYELRGILEGHAARLAAERRGRVELARLADVLEAMEDAILRNDDDGLVRLNGTFHDLIAESSQNSYLQTQIRSIRENFERYRAAALSVPGRRERAHDEHTWLVAAIKDRDAASAERIARTHAREALRHRIDGSAIAQRADSVRDS